MIKPLLIIIVALFLVGCSSVEPTDEEVKAELAELSNEELGAIQQEMDKDEQKAIVGEAGRWDPQRIQVGKYSLDRKKVFSLLKKYQAEYKFNFEISCTDGYDNDNDGKTDCADMDCDGKIGGTGQITVCESAKEVSCSDNLNNDGSIDCNLDDFGNVVCVQDIDCGDLDCHDFCAANSCTTTQLTEDTAYTTCA